MNGLMSIGGYHALYSSVTAFPIYVCSTYAHGHDKAHDNMRQTPVPGKAMPDLLNTTMALSRLM